MTNLSSLCDRIARSPWSLLFSGALFPFVFIGLMGATVWQYWVELTRDGGIGLALLTLGFALAAPIFSGAVLARRTPAGWRLLTVPILFYAATLVAFHCWLPAMARRLTFASDGLLMAVYAGGAASVFHLGLYAASRPAGSKWLGITWSGQTVFALVCLCVGAMFFVPVIGGAILEPLGHFEALIVAMLFCGLLFALGFFFLLLRMLVLMADRCLALQKQSRNFDLFLKIVIVWALPFCGLMLNIKIPFPMPCYSPWYLAMTFLTGLFILLPPSSSENAALRWFGWLTRWAVYPFTLYFFFLFLPFMPIAIFAIVIMGAGFLIFAPTLLMALHSHTLLDDARWLRARGASIRMLAITGLLAFSVIPAGLAARAGFHRAVLHDLLATCLNADSAIMNRPPLRRPVIAKHVLKEAYDFKNGVSVPLLSWGYRRLVFDGLTLPDDRLDSLWRTVTSDPRPEKPRNEFGLHVLSSQDDAFRRERRWHRAHPTEGVTALSAKATRLPGEHDDEITLHLTLGKEHATSLSQGQYGYTGTLHLPPAAFVTGLSLKIGDAWEEGRLFERTAAEWVYRRITEQRLDPALLTAAAAPGHYTLQVFPVEEHRQVRITLVVPPGCAEPIRINGLTVFGDSVTENGDVCYTAPGVLATTEGWSAARADAPAAPFLTAVIIDAGEKGLPLTFNEPALALRRALPALAIEAGTGIRAAFVTSEAEAEAFLKDSAPRFGGCDLPGALRVAQRAARDRGLALAPSAVSTDQSGIDKRLEALWKPSDRPPRKGYRLPSIHRLLPADAPARIVWPAQAPLDPADLPGRVVTLPPESRWAKAAAAWSLSQAQLDAPGDRALRARLIAVAREARTLIPQNSWIVVEERSQWIELGKQERAMLKAGAAFSIKGDAPEMLLLVLLLGGAFAVRRRARRK